MRVVRFALVVLAAFALSVSFVIPADDVIETAYDESEALPYESTVPYSTMQQETALALKSDFTLYSPGAKSQTFAGRPEREAHPICDSVTLLDRSLRC